MKKIIALLAAFFAGSAGAITTHHEASMNFDKENVRPFLERVNSNLSLGLDVDKLVEFTESLEVGEEKRLEFSVQYNGQTLGMIYQVYMDDIDAPDLYLFVETEELESAIQSEMVAFAESLGL